MDASDSRGGRSKDGEDVFGPWSVLWGEHSCRIRPLGEFPYAKIVLPVEMISANDKRGTGYVILTLDPDFRVAVLLGAHIHELERFISLVTTRVRATSKVL